MQKTYLTVGQMLVGAMFLMLFSLLALLIVTSGNPSTSTHSSCSCECCVSEG